MFTSLRFTLVTALLSILAITVFAQEQSGHCGFDDLHQQKLQSDKEYAKRHAMFNTSLYKYRTEKIREGRVNKQATNQIYTIPVVVHIIHQNGAENISDAQVKTALNMLNDGFGNAGSFFSVSGVDVPIRFCLATADPSGDPTSGINRIVSPLTIVNRNTQDLQLKSLIHWDPTQYLNIYVVKSICSSATECHQTLGYSYMAAAH